MICKTSLLITVPSLLFIQTWVCAEVKGAKSQENAEIQADSVSLVCPTNLTVEEIGFRQWNITPYLSHNFSNLTLTITIGHGPSNSPKSLEIQFNGFSSPDIVLKVGLGSKVKYTNGNAKSLVTTNLKNRMTQCQLSAVFQFHLSLPFGIVPNQLDQESKSNNWPVPVIIGVTVLFLAMASVALAVKLLLYKRNTRAEYSIMPIHSQCKPSLVELNDPSQPKNVNQQTCSSFLLDETFGNRTFIPEMENLSLDNAETSSTTGYCSISDVSFSEKPLSTLVHSQKSCGPSETFNPDRDLPSSADPRYCDYGWVDYEGGSLAIKNTGVGLHIPKYAIPRGKREIIYIALQKAGEDNPPLEDKDALLSPIVICGPDGMQFQKQVFLTIPHCAGVTEENSWNMEVKSRNDEPGSVSEWETKSSSKGSECYDTYCKVEPKECILMFDHFTRYCVVGRPKTAPSSGQETNAQRKEQQPKSNTPTEGAVGGVGCQEGVKDKKEDEGHLQKQKASKSFEEDKKENQAYKFVAIVAYSSPPSVDKDCAVRVYCIPDLKTSFEKLKDLERENHNGQISDAGHKVLKFYGSGENLIITTDVEKFKGWELSPGSKHLEEIPFDIVWNGKELELPPNVRFLYSRVDKDVYHFRSEYEARQDKRGATVVRFHANSSIEKRNSSSSGYSSTKDADPINYQLPVAVKRRLCILLDPREELISYWPDLAEKLGCDAEYIWYLKRGLQPGASPTDKLLELWESEKSEEIPVHRLKEIFQEMRRDDCAEVIDHVIGACCLSQN